MTKIQRPSNKLMQVIADRTFTQSEVQTMRSLLKDVLFSLNQHNANQRKAMGVYWQLAEPGTDNGEIAFGAYSAVRRALQLDTAKRKKYEAIQRKLRKMV